jgi:excisionase family DNA binding protein
MSELAVIDPPAEAFYTDKSLARRLSVSERTVRDWRLSKKLAYYELGGSVRIDPADVDSFLADRRIERRAA